MDKVSKMIYRHATKNFKRNLMKGNLQRKRESYDYKTPNPQ